MSEGMLHASLIDFGLTSLAAIKHVQVLCFHWVGGFHFYVKMLLVPETWM
jgi:hypothetical protein